ncbi:MAG: thioredoxin domain-containing protein [Acidobacteriota bacterium]
MDRSLIRLFAAAALAVSAGSGATAQDIDALITRFAVGYLTYVPGATAEIKSSQPAESQVGPYLAMTVVRSSLQKEKSPEQLNLLVDPKAKLAAVGMVFPLPQVQPAVTADTLPAYVEQVLPQLLRQLLAAGVRVRWPGIPTRLGPVVPLQAEVASGYGTMRMPIAISADARWLVLGGTWPLDRDPRAVRREILASVPIEWDPGHEGAVVKVVEFSDYQCPACKRGWQTLRPALDSFGEKVRHGMVNWPIPSSHPWAFKASAGAVCVANLAPGLLLDFKDEMYRLQDTTTLDTVDAAVFAFVATRGLDEQAFRACYMKDQALEKVLRQMEFGYRLGVTGTPTYFANGEAIPWWSTDWATRRIQAIAAAGGKPENAPDITLAAPAPEPPPSR